MSGRIDGCIVDCCDMPHRAANQLQETARLPQRVQPRRIFRSSRFRIYFDLHQSRCALASLFFILSGSLIRLIVTV